MNIKCRKAGLSPSMAVLVVTVRAMKMNGGVISKNDLGQENVEAVKLGCSNLGRHIENVKSFGVPVVVAINHFITDTDTEIETVKKYVAEQGSEAILCKHWGEGSQGIIPLAQRVVEMSEKDENKFSPLYEDKLSLFEKIETVAKKI